MFGRKEIELLRGEKEREIILLVKKEE